jgi:hypothetical protein
VLAALVAALASLGCSNSSSGSPASSSRFPSPSVNALIAADSKAADLRTRLDLLLAEHVMAIAKESSAAATRSDAYEGYAALLITNGSDLTELMRSAFGDTAASQFDQMWSTQNGYFVDYTTGLVTHNQSKSSGAMSGLVNGFVPQLAQFLTSMTQIPLDPTTQLALEQVLEVQKAIDEQVAQSYVKMYADLHTAYAQTSRLGDPLAARIALKFPDKFPGNPSNKGSDMRVSLNVLLQEHTYLASMTTDAGLAGRGPEQAAGQAALAANADSLGTLFSDIFGTAVGTQFDQLWAARDTALIAYAGSGSAAPLASLTDTFVAQFSAFAKATTGLPSARVSGPALAQVKAAALAIDDQRNKSYTRLALDDRSSATSIQPIADLIANATVAKLPGRFSG